MGVVSNKINIMELQKSGGGGGDPTIPGRVSALENEMSGVYASINQISTVELPKVYSSISAVSALILDPVTGLEGRVEVLEQGKSKVTAEADGTKTYSDLINELKTKMSAVYDSMSNGQTLYIEQLIPDVGNFAMDYVLKPTTKDTDVSLPTSFAFSCVFDYNAIGGYFVMCSTSSVSYTQQMWSSTNQNFTVTQKKNDVPAAGNKLEVTYHIE